MADEARKSGVASTTYCSGIHGLASTATITQQSIEFHISLQVCAEEKKQLLVRLQQMYGGIQSSQQTELSESDILLKNLSLFLGALSEFIAEKVIDA